MEWLAVAPGLLLAGALAGVLAGLFGIGVGVVLVPVMAGLLPLPGVAPELRVQLAVGTSLAMTVPTSWLAARRHAAAGRLDAALLRRLGPALVLGVLAGVALAAWVSGAVLTGLFGVVALAVAVYVALPSRALAVPAWLRQALTAASAP